MRSTRWRDRVEGNVLKMARFAATMVVSAAFCAGALAPLGPISAALAARAPTPLVHATAPNAVLGPGQSFTTEISAAGRTHARTVAGVATITLPAPVAGGPIVTFAAQPGVACSAPASHPLRRLCRIPTIAARQIVQLATVTAASPSTVSNAGAEAVASVHGPANNVNITWRWALPDLTGSLTLSPPSLMLGYDVTGDLAISNLGGATTSAFTTTIPMPGPATIVSQPPGEICIPYDSELDCYTPGMASQSTIHIQFTYVPPSGPTASLSGTVDAYGNVVESNKASNRFTSNPVTVVGTGVNFSLSFDEPSTVDQGSELTRGVVIAN